VLPHDDIKAQHVKQKELYKFLLIVPILKREGIYMHIYTEIYEFAASAGAFEGYVYPKREIDPNYLPEWVGHLVAAYEHLSPEVCKEIQSSLNGTLGRAVRALIPILGEEDETVKKLRSMIVGDLPETVDDFQKEKWFKQE